MAAAFPDWEVKRVVRNPGVLLDEDLSRAYIYAGPVVIKCVNQSHTAKFIISRLSFILMHLDYCNLILAGLLKFGHHSFITSSTTLPKFLLNVQNSCLHIYHWTFELFVTNSTIESSNQLRVKRSSDALIDDLKIARYTLTYIYLYNIHIYI